MKNYVKIILDNKKLYDCEYLHKYVGLEYKCLICEYERLPTILLGDEESNKKKSGKNSIGYHNSSFNNLIKFKILKNVEIKEVAIEKKPSSNKHTVSFNHAYHMCNFINAIDLDNQSQVIKIFDSKIFAIVLQYSYRSSIIEKFIDIFLNIKFSDYSKYIRIECFYILIFCYIYKSSQGLSVKDIAKKIDGNRYLFVPTEKFKIIRLRDPFIMKFTLKMMEIDSEHSKALHLAYIYVFMEQDYNFFKLKFIEYSKTISDELFYSFLKFVFTHTIITYKNLSDEDLYQLIICYFRKRFKPETNLIIYEILYKKTIKDNLRELVINAIYKLNLSSKKYIEMVGLIKLDSLTSLKEHEDFLYKNYEDSNLMILQFNTLKELFISLKFIPKDLFESKKAINLSLEEYRNKFALEMLKILLMMESKSEAPCFKSNLLSFITIISDAMESISIIDVDVYNFNQNFWSNFSKLLLQWEKISLENDLPDLKSGNSTSLKVSLRKNTIYRSLNRLWKAIVVIESNLVDLEYKKVIRVKQKGFKILNSKNK